MAKKGKFDADDIDDLEEGLEEEVEETVEKGQDHKHRQGVASPEEQRDRANKMKTQGRRGCRMPRVNLSISPENYDFIHVIAKASGRTMTRTINDIIDLYRNQKRNRDFYETAKDLVDNNKFWEGEKWTE